MTRMTVERLSEDLAFSLRDLIEANADFGGGAPVLSLDSISSSEIRYVLSDLVSSVEAEIVIDGSFNVLSLLNQDPGDDTGTVTGGSLTRDGETLATFALSDTAWSIAGGGATLLLEGDLTTDLSVISLMITDPLNPSNYAGLELDRIALLDNGTTAIELDLTDSLGGGMAFADLLTSEGGEVLAGSGDHLDLSGFALPHFNSLDILYSDVGVEPGLAPELFVSTVATDDRGDVLVTDTFSTEEFDLPAGQVVERVTGGAGDDRLTLQTGQTAGIALDGGAGNDTLTAETGGGSLFGGAGEDFLLGSAGDDFLDPGSNGLTDFVEGSAGNDTISFGDPIDSRGLSFFVIRYSSGSFADDMVVDLDATSGTVDKGAAGIDQIQNLDLLDDGIGVMGIRVETGSGNDLFDLDLLPGVHFVEARGGAGNDTIQGGSVFTRVGLGFAGADHGAIVDLGAGLVLDDGFGTVDVLVNVDEVRATRFADSLMGGGGDDSFIPLGGNDTIAGGVGFDRIRYDQSPHDLVGVDLAAGMAAGDANGAAFIDRFTSIERAVGTLDGQDLMAGTTGDDELKLSGGRGFVDGRAGDDTIVGGSNFATLTGGAGDDVFVIGGGNEDVFIAGGGSIHTITDFEAGVTGGDVLDLTRLGFSAFNEVLATATQQGDDVHFRFDSGDYLILEGVTVGDFDVSDFLLEEVFAPDDTGSGAIAGDSAEQAGEARPVGISAVPAADVVTDVVVPSGAAAQVSDAPASASIDLFGGAGDESLTGGDDDDFLSGNGGNDTLTGAAGADNLLGGIGNDLLFGGDDADFVQGGEGADTLDGGDGDDIILGDGGNDFVNPGTNSFFDQIFGSTGDDTISFADAPNGSGSTFFLIRYDQISSTGIDVVIGPDSGTVDKGETAGGGDLGTDSLIDLGQLSVNTRTNEGLSILGTNGDDVVTVNLPESANFFDFRPLGGNDTIEGGDVFTRVSYFNGTILVNLARGEVQDGLGGTDSLRNIDEIRATNGDDVLIGDDQNNSFIGQAGNDTILGGGGDSDRVRYDRTGIESVFVDLEAGVAQGVITVSGQEQDFRHILSGIEKVLGSDQGIDVLNGSRGNDILRGQGGIDLIDGRAGDDTLAGESGFNTLTGGAGDDLFGIGFGGVDVITDFQAGAGTEDRLDISGTGISSLAALSAIAEQSGSDLLLDFDGTQFLTLRNVAFADLHADDFIFAVPGSAATQAGRGESDLPEWLDDSDPDMPATAAAITQNGTDGTDVLNGTLGDDQIFGGAGNDFISGGDGALFGIFDGNDLLNPGSNRQFDQVSGGTGNDTIDFADAFNGSGLSFFSLNYSGFDGADLVIVMDANGGTIDKGDTFGFVNGIDTLINVDPLYSTTRSNNEGFQIVLGDGDDFVSLDLPVGVNFSGVIAGGGDDTIIGGDQFERVVYSGGALRGIVADLTNGTVEDGRGGTDTLQDIFEIDGTNFADSMSGSDDDESFIGRLGDDTIDGGGGLDRARYDRALIDFVSVDLAAGIAIGNGTNGGGLTETFRHTLIDIEIVLGSDGGPDFLAGSAAAETFFGQKGLDVIDGRGGDDTLVGEEGANTLTGGSGDDLFVLIGGGQDVITDFVAGAGSDDRLDVTDTGVTTLDEVLALANPSGDDTILRFAGGQLVVLSNVAVGDLHADDFLFAEAGGDQALLFTLAADETLTGTGAGEVLDGQQDTNDLIRGGDGNDTLSGLGLHDTLIGEAGDDSLDGGDGLDSLLGGLGDDTLSGGAFGDTLSGNAGSDLLDGGDGDDLLRPGGNDAAGGGDRIIMGAGQDTVDFAGADGGLYVLDLRDDPSVDRIVLGQDVGLLFGTDETDELHSLGALSDSGSTLRIVGDGSGQVFEATNADLTAAVELRLAGGNDEVLGGANGLRVSYADALGGIAFDGTTGLVGDDGNGGQDTLLSVARLDGSALSDLILGGDIDQDMDIRGGAGADTLSGGGGDDTLAGGVGTDLFQVIAAAGSDRIVDFDTASETIDLTALDIFDFASLQALARAVGGDLVFDLAPDQSLILADTGLVDLAATNFLFGQEFDQPVQVVEPDQPGVIIQSGEALTVSAVYRTAAPVDPTLSGLGLRLHFDSTSLSFDGFENLFTTALQPFGQIVEADVSDFDGDAATDSFIAVNWADFSQNWPGTDSQLLYDALFTSLDGGDAVVNFTASSTAAGRVFSGQSFIVVGDRWDLPSTVSVAENSSGGSVVADLTPALVDPDDPGTYTLLDDAGGRFVLDGFSLKVATGADLDFEAVSSHTVELRIASNTGAVADRVLTVNLTDVNEAPETVELDVSSVAEGAAAGTVVGTLSGDDPEGDVLIFTLLDDAGGRFALNGDQLVVADGDLLDFESATSHAVRVEARDPSGLTLEELLTIDVTDVAEATLDLDGNGVADALSDGLIALGRMFGAPVAQLSGFAQPGSPGSDPVELEARLQEAEAGFFDVDGNGTTDALSDGLMILGFLFGAPSQQLAGFADPGGTRSSAGDIATFLDSVLPQDLAA